MTQETMLLLLGGLISIIFRFFPGLGPKFEALQSNIKQLIMIAVLAVATAVVYLMNCKWGMQYLLTDNLILACGTESIQGLTKVFLSLVIGNQITYPLIKK